MPGGSSRARAAVIAVVGAVTLAVGGCAGTSSQPAPSASSQPAPSVSSPLAASPSGVDATPPPLPGSRTVTGRSSTVSGTVDEATLTAYASMADRAVAQVSTHWSHPWPRQVSIVAPADATAFRALVGRADDLSQVAAVTDGPVDPTTGLATGDRVVLNPDAFRSLTPVGRQFVITHESTHVAVRASLRGAPPLWLAEGFADHVGYAASGRRKAELAAALLDEVDAGRGPTQLPAQADFDPAQGQIAPTYLASWLAVELIDRRHGPRALQRFYEASTVDTSPAAADAATDTAFGSVLGTTREAFTRLWLSELAVLASPK